jgi:hypothetical protein
MRQSIILFRLARLLLPTLLALVLGVAMAWAFAEEPLGFRDPYSGATTGQEISTIHFDLTYAMALAAGFSITDSRTLQIWNQLVDSEVITVGGTITYTNCGGAFYPEPNANTICKPGQRNPRAWPPVNFVVAGNTCVTSRFGPYMPLFHFPHLHDLAAMRDWAWGKANTLSGYQAYAWGSLSTIDAPCKYTATTVITTAIRAGSLEAFATYLHSLADYYSHRDCIAAMDSMGMPWATHSISAYHNIYACNYNPANPTNDDAHGREFGDAYTDSLRTDAATHAIYGELVMCSLQREGDYYPLALDTPLAGITGTLTLSQALAYFVHEWDFAHPAERRTYADAIVQAVLRQRLPMRHTRLPVILKE